MLRMLIYVESVFNKKMQFKFCKIPKKIGGVKSTVYCNDSVFRKVPKQMFMLLTTVCKNQLEY